MSILPRDALPSVAGIDQQMIEDIVLDDIVNHDYDRTTKLTLLAVMMLVQDEISDEEYYAQEDDESFQRKNQAELRKIGETAKQRFREEREAEKRRKEEGLEEEEEEDEEEEEEEEEEFEEEYDDEEEETEESEEEEESETEESDDGSEWDSLFLLVHNMPVENEEPKSIVRKRSLPRDDSPCPPPRPQAAKRQKIDPLAASKAPVVQDSGKDAPTPVTRKRGLITTQDETPATEVPLTKRQRLAPSANEKDDADLKGQETRSLVPSEWLAPQEELQNTQLPAYLQGLLGRLPISELHPEAQEFILGLNYSDPSYEDMAKTGIDMGLRFSKTAKTSEYKIVFHHMMRHPIQAVMYNACRADEAQHHLFWEKVRNVTGKEIPPERIKERRERRAQREAEAMARFKARKAAEEARKESRMLKEKYVSQIGEASKLPLKEKVGRWLAEIVQAEKK
ncbi:uncharacterized protein FIESC28_04808 [Fusarium coffeatum]|uniref:Uncharacterized protein n=1 Tax=Fusarium coffeatum TaxID=231269 RepID=A0A366RYN6_9HYPO|nr:uncharacterized protein FIESC28_04808 [Fusarium coffeatum]RBR21540.1 hypothetical protein FIESC28_04808 [Fusarium coffeatum]